MAKTMIRLSLLVCLVFLFVGCSAVQSPVSNGLLFTSVKGPITATSNVDDSKVGEASCATILGIISVGDCSIEAAMQQGGIKKVQHVDHKSISFLGVYARFTTIVYGQ